MLQSEHQLPEGCIFHVYDEIQNIPVFSSESRAVDPIVKDLTIHRHRGFDIVGNFSAHKHVRSEKDIYSVEALLQNNVLRAKLLLDLLTEFPPEEYFCVSTDKAANPVNIL